MLYFYPSEFEGSYNILITSSKNIYTFRTAAFNHFADFTFNK